MRLGHNYFKVKRIWTRNAPLRQITILECYITGNPTNYKGRPGILNFKRYDLPNLSSSYFWNVYTAYMPKKTKGDEAQPPPTLSRDHLLRHQC